MRRRERAAQLAHMYFVLFRKNGSSRRRSKMIDYPDVGRISADKALRLHFSSDKRAAAERIRRVRGDARAGTRAGTRPVEISTMKRGLILAFLR